MKKRIMSALLAAAMAFTLLPAAAWAATPIASESGVSQERAEIPLDRSRDSAPAAEDVPMASAEISADDSVDHEAQIDAADEPLPELPEDAPTAPLASIHTARADEPMAMALESGIPYLDWDDSQKKLVDKICDSATTVESTTTAWDGGWYVVSASVTIESRITVTGEAHLILEDGFTLTAKSGLEVSEGNSLTIYGQTRQTGKLKATSNSYNAGIGGNYDGGSGAVTINGGDITAEGTNAGAGIGGGRDRAGGTIVINGGTVSAKGQVGGAAIGGGSAGDGGSITINGGNVTAQGRGGAGIGGGGNGNGGTVTITGGTVKTTGGTYGAGIGGGEKGSGGAVTITGGTVTANGGSEGAGIGGGQNGAGGTVTITGGTVTTKGGTDAAGIGGGNGGDGGTVTINGGTVTANGDTYVASIGGGQDGGNDGSFSTGESGNAVIFASSQYVDDGIADTSQQASWSGIIFNGNTGEIYGAPVPGYDFNIQSGKTLNVKNGQTLHIGAGVTMTNNGTVNIGDASNLNAVLDNEGTINNKKTIDVWGQLTNGETGITNQNSGQIVYHFELEVTPPTFDEAKSGYAQPEAENITITSTDEIDATITSVSITGEDFALNHGNNAKLANGVSDTSWTIQPKAGLSAGEHTAAIAVTYSGSIGAPDKTATAEVTFAVSSMAEGSGTADVPYLIPDLATLEAVRDYINSGNGGGEYFKLTDDIDMSTKYNEDSDTSWTPIRGSKQPFQGTFDGGDFTISGLYINTEEDYQGLFGYSSGTIKNLTVSGSITGSGDSGIVGGIVGYNAGGSIVNCHNEAAIATMTTSSFDIGGIVGWNAGGNVENCHNAGAVESGANRIGGIVGYNAGDASVKNCYNTGTVSGPGWVGGIVGDGENTDAGGRIENCYNTGKISGTNTDYTGGIEGVNGSSVKKCYYLDTCGAGGRWGGTSKTTAQFASGEVAYLLQNGQDAQVWGQKLSSGADEYPVLTSDTSKKVLKVTFLSDSAEHAVRYTNPNGTVTLPSEPTKANYTFEKWSQSNDAAGAEFDEKTPVTEDMTVYAVGHDHFGGEKDEIPLDEIYGYSAALTVDLDKYMKYANGSIAAAGKFAYEVSDQGGTGASIVNDHTLSVPTGLNAGDYTIQITATEKAPQYSLMSVGSYGTDPVTLTVKVGIARAAATVTAPTAKELTYTGAAQELVAAGSVESVIPGCGTMQYSLDGSAYSAHIPTGEGAKTYTVYWTVDGADETNYAYSAATSGQVEVTIDKATAQVTVPPTARDLTYTGEEQALVSGGESNFGALVYSLAEEGPFTGEIPAETEAGTYTVYYKVEGTDNWDASDVGHVQAEIKKAASSATVTGSAGLVYSGAPQPLVASGASDTGKVVYALGESATAAPGDGYTETIPTGTNAGTYYVWWKVLGDVDHGDTAPACLTVTIAKAESSATPPTAKTLTYNGAPQALVEVGTPIGGAMKYALGDAAQATADYGDAIPEGTDAGTYYVWYKVAGDANHNDTAPAKVEVTIAQAAATVTAPKANTSLTYTGTAQELIDAGSVTSGVPGCGTMRYSLEEGSGFAAEIPTGTDAQGYTVYWTVDGADETNYAYSAATSGEVTVTISKAAAQVTTPPAARDLTYTGEEQALVAAGESNFGALVYSLDDPEGPFTGEIPAATEAGLYTVYYMVEEADNWNASPVGSVPVEIHPADSSATVRRRTGLVYSGEAQALVTAGNVTGGQLVYALGEDAELVPASGYTGRTPAATDAGTYYVWWKILGDVDHGDTDPACLTVTIAPFPLTLEPVAAETPYTGAAIFVPVTQTVGQTPAIDPAKLAVSYEQNGAAAEPVLPGTYDVLVAVTDPNFALAGTAKVGTLTITHVHVYAEEWTHDESNHWHVCQGVGPCDAPQSGLAAHTLNWVDDGDGTGHQACTACGYATGAHTHASETWHVDEASGQHYKTCDVCGAAFDQANHELTWANADPALHWQACAVCGWAGEKTAHVWDGGVVTQAPTAEAEGSRLYTCAVCGATKREAISKLDTFQISGTVTDQAGAPLPRAAVRLTRGQETVAETVTDDQGRYSFFSVPAGLYNVAATWEDVTKTILVELSDADADQRDIQMPSGKVSSVVEVLGEDTPDVVVGGVDAIAEAEATSPAETVTVTLTVAKQEEPTDKEEIDRLVAGQKDDVLYLDVSLLKQINTRPTQTITDTGARVLEIVVPYDFTGKRSVTVYRKHGTDPAAALTALAARPDLAAEDGTFFADEENGWIAIYASKFSTYAIGYQTVASGSSSVARYVLTATAGEGGTIDPAGAIRVRRGADQSYTIRPEAGYAVADVLVDGVSVGAVTAYTFENVAAAHTIQAVFQKAGESASGLPFSDVAPGDWFYDSVKEVYQRGLMQGVAAATFAPAQGATRATVATILWRLAGSPEAQTHPAYADCVPDAWYAQAVAWADEAGVAVGYGDGRFGPDDPITREQLALMLWRYAAAQGRDVSVGEDTNILSYQDFDQIADWAIPGLQWAAGSGVLRGTGSGATLSPKTPSTRAELAAILARYCGAATLKETNEAE